MKVKYTTPNNRITVELEADTQVEVFSQLSAFQEVFGETNCGKCGSDNLKFQIRNVDDNRGDEVISLLDPLGENNIVEDVEIQELWEN